MGGMRDKLRKQRIEFTCLNCNKKAATQAISPLDGKTITCPHCGATYSGGDGKAGKQIDELDKRMKRFNKG